VNRWCEARLAGASGDEGTARVEIRFISPTLLKRRGEIQRTPEFEVLWHAVQLRLSLLRLAHGAGRPEIDFRASLERAEAVRLEAWQSTDVSWERYSRRQDRRVPMGGFVGTARYRGVPVEFLPALKLGTLVGVGDNCTFGQGRYEIGLPAGEGAREPRERTRKGEGRDE
jgi:CRISPR/Cas system endoribonuclease Cas6 (RAMP superfamily)